MKCVWSRSGSAWRTMSITTAAFSFGLSSSFGFSFVSLFSGVSSSAGFSILPLDTTRSITSSFWTVDPDFIDWSVTMSLSKSSLSLLVILYLSPKSVSSFITSSLFLPMKSGTSTSSELPLLTTTFIRLFFSAWEPSPGSCLIMMPSSCSLSSS